MSAEDAVTRRLQLRSKELRSPENPVASRQPEGCWWMPLARLTPESEPGLDVLNTYRI